MADTQETRILKDINRHLAHIDESGDKGMTDRLSPSETASLNKNVQEIMGNFSSLINSQLKNSIKATSDAISSAFGQIDNDGEIAALDDIVDELKVSNQFADQADHNKFLEEQEREDDLKINRRTNELLEDLNDKEDDSAKQSKKDGGSSSGMMKGIFGGLLAGGGIKGLLGATKLVAKGLFFPALIGLAGFEFMKGWKEAGEDASVVDKFKSAIGRMASDLTFGLISKDFLTGAMDKVDLAIRKAWKSFADIWNDPENGFAAKIDKTLSSLTFGVLSQSDVEGLREKTTDLLSKLNTSINNVLTESLGFDLGAAVQDFYAGINDFIDNTVLLFTDPVGLLIQKLRDIRDGITQDEKSKAALAEKGDISKVSSVDMLKKIATGDLTEAEKQSLMDQEKEKFKNSMEAISGFFRRTFDFGKESIKRIGEENARDARQKEGLANLKALRKDPSNVGQESMRQKIANEQRRRETKADGGGGNAMQINNNSTIAAPVDTQVENNDALNLNRSSGASGN
jgi:hypothetical protein